MDLRATASVAEPRRTPAHAPLAAVPTRRPSDLTKPDLRVPAAAGVAGIAFIGSYTVLHLLHVAHLEPRFLRALAAIPLFARFIASSGVALAAGLAGAIFVRGGRRLFAWLPRLIVATSASLAVVLALFP